MVRIGSVILNVRDVKRGAAFWRSALGYVSPERNPAIVAPESGDGVYLLLDADDRSHVDLHADSYQEQQSEVERLLSLGATRPEWSYPPDADFVVLADPDGNLFCIIDTSH